ncbi:FadR/GntR family transcriptional regulator [Microbacterium sp. SA39]|uniref:FadR/GntR family transcriptional regulator n=1 Tax=Microbacterium sp. SA39 TaxID=1263625 RepID=UPI0005FA8D7F|nr:FCD domain-containing protein [Microbacterium sp. SA39]KJQ55415.1 HTH-type transcriptional regulator LutR [Microbacterium sp. SA39]
MSDKYAEEDLDLSDALYRRLAQHLQRSGIQPGDALPSEADLGDELGLGRQRVREALGVLEAFGVVVSRQGARRVWRGFRAADLATRWIAFVDDPESATRELLEVRHALETSLLPMVIPRLTTDDLVRLRTLSEQMVERALRGESFAEQDQQFHRGLLAPMGNAFLDQFLHSFWVVFSASESDKVEEDPVIAAMHGRIIDAIEAGDTRRAVHELDAHFYGVRNRYPDIAFGATADLTV